MHREIIIIKSKIGTRKVQYAGYVVGEYYLLDEAKDFAVNYQYGLWLEIWEDDKLIEKINK